MCGIYKGPFLYKSRSRKGGDLERGRSTRVAKISQMWNEIKTIAGKGKERHVAFGSTYLCDSRRGQKGGSHFIKGLLVGLSKYQIQQYYLDLTRYLRLIMLLALIK